MMATPSYPPTAAAEAAPVAVVSPHFCVGHPVDLIITRKMMTFKAGTFTVADVNENIVFNIQGKALSLHDRRLLLDAAGNPLLTYQQKMMTAHRRWQAFRGDSSDQKDMIFSVRKSTIFQMKTKLEVFMAGNSEEEHCDFRIEGNWFKSACTIYAGDTTTVIAQMHKKRSAQSILLGKDKFCVTIYPNVDHAFVVALIAILAEINEDRNTTRKNALKGIHQVLI